VMYRPLIAVAAGLLLMAAGCRGRVVDSLPTSAFTPSATVTAWATTPAPVPDPTRIPDAAPPAPPTATPSPQQGPLTHTVRPGDTLLGLALEYRVPMAAIQLQNGIGDSDVIQVGQVLLIPSAADWEGASPFWRVHIVKAGETVSGIARAYEITTEELKAVNDLADADVIGVGQELVVPLNAPIVPPSPTPPPTRAPAPVAQPSPTAIAAAPAVTPPPPDALSEWAYELARLINEVRAQHGLPPLAYNETLAQVAQAHANDCLQRGRGGHIGSDGSTVKMRMQRAGYDPLYWSECWAHTTSPRSALDMWMNETPPNDPHRRTILSTTLTEIGVGIVKPAWGYYFFANFGTPRR
ncbi:MAG: LysM peptidoglycan-binding domain-containing protein, partial [Anaerolineae bacterium]|nr:LysM peptidoglycan-binding domain-containing protein [Anaerolineae bacterium]